MNRETIRLITIVICLAVLASGGWNAVRFSSLGQGYTTGYEGAKACFYGIEYNAESDHLISGLTTFPLKGTTFHFDADQIKYPQQYACNLEGEMTAVFIPEGPRPAGWVPADWWDIATGYIQNPIHHYEWNIRDDEKNETTLYAMDEYKLKWYFSISAEWDVSGITHSEINDRRYTDTKIWFEFDLSPIWYFEGAEKCYFSIAELRISDIALGGKLGDEREKTDEASESCRVSPMSKSSIIPIYYKVYGLESNRAEKEAYTFQGKKLNPALFTDKVYSYFTLNNFGTELTSKWGGLEKYWKGDVVTVGFDFHVFVVGEWKVKDIQEVPEDYGRTSQTGKTSGILDYLGRVLSNMLGVLSSPMGQIWLLLGIVALIFLVLAIFAPAVLFSLLGMAKGLTKGRKKGKT